MQSRHGEKGVTLIELLVVIAIVAIIAAMVIPNITAFRITSTLAVANDEASNVKTAAIAYLATYEEWPDTSDALEGDLLAGELRARYVFNEDGFISENGTDPSIGGGWGDVIEWDEEGQAWVRK
ncbi:MAG: prepilin-type N-terminal cleavage/methylation domain-containing protein [Dehalococcoidia bacterium]